ncbi:MAG: hypothetical protein HQL31_01325 [Planctomycetes bacterium]|nr:hypothetical protein [Planctomycetota bacterium]
MNEEELQESRADYGCTVNDFTGKRGGGLLLSPFPGFGKTQKNIQTITDQKILDF